MSPRLENWDIARLSISSVPALALVGLGLLVGQLPIQTQDDSSNVEAAVSTKPSIRFNPIQIKDGWIVRLYKDGRIKQRLKNIHPRKRKMTAIVSKTPTEVFESLR
jgi:hypothetical protein